MSGGVIPDKKLLVLKILTNVYFCFVFCITYMCLVFVVFCFVRCICFFVQCYCFFYLLSFTYCILLLYCVYSSSVLSIVSLHLLFGHVVREAVLLSLVNVWYVLRRLQSAVFVLLYPSS